MSSAATARTTPYGDPGAAAEPVCVDDLTRQNVQAMQRLEEAALASRSRSDRIASLIARFCGSMTFVGVHVAIFSFWLLVNSASAMPHFDPYPFTLLTLVVSLEAIFLSTFILISQNHELRISERRNQLDLQINLLTEQENTKMLQMLERIAKKVGVSMNDDPAVHILKKATHPEVLVEQIEQAQRDGAASSRQA
ncbi:DUF1003 domain-containing protein [Polaromonas sp.]|uniref:DUF1003 domain-containing protein n=1 Tax=Polaromonas sp. TaxID=1869339 RepID=UPI0024894C47|nr:DUF1003 domain-containing protein [Polaromonas sp.]MDI1274541.1 DUF1003 domain-containing protein [Polaromonas sp.]